MYQSSIDKMALVAELAKRRFAWLGEAPAKIVEVGGTYDDYRKLFQKALPCVYKTMNARYKRDAPQNSDIITEQAYAWPELEDESYDVVISGQVFHHVEFYWATLLEMRRVLKKGGLLCIIAPSHWYEHRVPFDCQRFYADGLMAMMKFAGLSTIYAYAEHEDLVGRIHCDAIVVAEKAVSSALSDDCYKEAHSAIHKLLPDRFVKEVSRGKLTLQSSVSWKYQKQGKLMPVNAVSGLFSGKYSFHTDYESEPWWMVDLEKIYELESIRIFNRQDSNARRSRWMDVLVSSDLRSDWRMLYSNKEPFGGILDGNPLVVKANSISARYVRLQLRETVSFHLDQVQVFGYI
jgi:SAM-dependent methyltransferase